MSQVFDSYSAYYDLFYKDKNYVAEVAYVRNLLRKFGNDVQDVLEFGSGTGIHGTLLSKEGFKVTGVELSQKMVDQAKQTESFKCQQGDMRTVRLNRTFDAVISLFHVMSYQTSNNDIKSALESAAVHLKPGGIFVFDVWYTPAVYGQKPDVRVKRMGNDNVKITRIAEPVVKSGESRVDVHYTVLVEDKVSGKYEIIDEVHPMRHFSILEIDLLAQMTGFEMIHTEAFESGEVPSEKTWGVCFVLRRKL